MQNRHEPDKQFVDKLEWQVASEARRRNQALEPSSFAWRFARVAAVVMLSMGLGAVAMAASYQLEESWKTELVQARLEMRLQLAEQRMRLLRDGLENSEEQFAVGTIDEETRDQWQLQLADAETQVATLQIDLSEVRASGREPQNDIASPLVQGRDYVSRRLERQLMFMDMRWEMAQKEIDRVEQRFQLGVERESTLESIRAAVQGLEAERQAVQERLLLRRRVLAGELTGVEAELQMLQEEAGRRAQVLRMQFNAAMLEVDRVRRQVEAGAIQAAELRQYELVLAEIEAELALTELEYQLVRRELEAQRQNQ